ncbi:unnamed protein product [Agarophyton chilense]
MEFRWIAGQTRASFDDLFYVDDNHAFFLIPATHAIIHVPDILEDCGPLTGTFQFLMERLLGETVTMVKLRSDCKPSLYHKGYKQFGFQKLKGGLHEKLEAMLTPKNSNLEDVRGRRNWETEKTMKMRRWGRSEVSFSIGLGSRIAPGVCYLEEKLHSVEGTVYTE